MKHKFKIGDKVQVRRGVDTKVYEVYFIKKYKHNKYYGLWDYQYDYYEYEYNQIKPFNEIKIGLDIPKE